MLSLNFVGEKEVPWANDPFDILYQLFGIPKLNAYQVCGSPDLVIEVAFNCHNNPISENEVSQNLSIRRLLVLHH